MTNSKKSSEKILLLSDSRGIYIPRDFTANFDLEKWGIDKKYKDLDPDSSDYWDDWDNVLMWAECIADDGTKYYLHQDGDLWAVPSNYDWEAEEC